jgi:2-keto-3-deoxy-L-rhamnonate aldolase RhmA
MTMLSNQKRCELKRKLSRRERVFGGWVSFREPAIAEIFAKAGLDFIAIDMEHTTITTDQANRIITGVQSEGGICPPRPVSHNNDYIKPLLEAGSDGLIIPVVNTRTEAEEQVRLQKFPPIGQRSYGVNRAHGYGFDFKEYIESWNESSILISQVETITAVDNIEQLVKTEGLDCIMVGPYDISGSLGVPGETDHPKVRNAAKHVVQVCAKAGISCMTQIADVKQDAIQDAFEQGYTAVVMGSDLFVLWKWAADIKVLMAEFR